MKTMLLMTVVALSASFASAAPACKHQAGKECRSVADCPTQVKHSQKGTTDKGTPAHSKSNAEQG